MFISVEICDFLLFPVNINRLDHTTYPVTAFAQRVRGPRCRILVLEYNTLQGIVVEPVAASQDGMTEILPDRGQALEHAADEDTHSQQHKQEHKVPAREDGIESQPVENRSERAGFGQLIQLHPIGV